MIDAKSGGTRRTGVEAVKRRWEPCRRASNLDSRPDRSGVRVAGVDVFDYIGQERFSGESEKASFDPRVEFGEGETPPPRLDRGPIPT